MELSQDADVQIVNDKELCLLIEAKENQNITVFQLQDGKAQQILQYQGSQNICIDNQQIYYWIEGYDYLWTYDLKTQDKKETFIATDKLKSMYIMNHQIFLGYEENPHFLDNDKYEFKGEVCNMVSLGDQQFAYVNEKNMLYIVDITSGEDIAAVNLYSEFKVASYEIKSLGGHQGYIGIYAQGSQRLEIIF